MARLQPRELLDNLVEQGYVVRDEAVDQKHACKAAIKNALFKLQDQEEFRLIPAENEEGAPDDVSAERAKLNAFEARVLFKLDAFFEQNGALKQEVRPEHVVRMYRAEVNALVSQLRWQETKNVVHAALMAVCGALYAVFAAVTFRYTAQRDYIGSFFNKPKFSAGKAKNELVDAAEQLTGLASGDLECFAALHKGENDEIDDIQYGVANRQGM